MIVPPSNQTWHVSTHLQVQRLWWCKGGPRASTLQLFKPYIHSINDTRCTYPSFMCNSRSAGYWVLPAFSRKISRKSGHACEETWSSLISHHSYLFFIRNRSWLMTHSLWTRAGKIQNASAHFHLLSCNVTASKRSGYSFFLFLFGIYDARKHCSILKLIISFRKMEYYVRFVCGW